MWQAPPLERPEAEAAFCGPQGVAHLGHLIAWRCKGFPIWHMKPFFWGAGRHAPAILTPDSDLYVDGLFVTLACSQRYSCASFLLK